MFNWSHTTTEHWKQYHAISIYSDEWKLLVLTSLTEKDYIYRETPLANEITF